MSSLISKAKEKLTGDSSGSSSPTRSPRNSTDRVIPPEPVQQQVDGDFSQHDTERPLQLHNLARANKRVKALEWDHNLAREAYVQQRVTVSARWIYANLLARVE